MPLVPPTPTAYLQPSWQPIQQGPPVQPFLTSSVKRPTSSDTFVSGQPSSASGPSGTQPTAPANPATKKRRIGSPKPNPNTHIYYQEDYQKFLIRLEAVNSSEIAEYNFGKPENLLGNPFAEHWLTLDQQHHELDQRVRTYMQNNPGKTPNDYLKAYTDHYDAMVHAEQAGAMETPANLHNRMLWLSNMLKKRHSPPTPLTTPWDLLDPSIQQLLHKVHQFQQTNPHASRMAYIQAYAKEYRQLAQSGLAANLQSPTVVAENLHWVEGLSSFLRAANIHPRF